MAKKSAISKGFRKQNAKKPYLSKRDIALLCLLVAAVAVAAIFLFRYDDGALKVEDGKVVVDGDNWLIVNGSNTRGGARYYKLGEIGELDGYTREAKPTQTNANVPEYVFTAEDAPIDTITVSASHASAQALSAYAAQSLASVEGAEVGEVQAAEMDGREVQWFIYTAGPAEGGETAQADESDEAAVEGDESAEESAEADEADDAAHDDAPYHSAICGYIDAPHGSSILARLEGGADSAEACPDEDALLAQLWNTLRAVTLEE